MATAAQAKSLINLHPPSSLSQQPKTAKAAKGKDVPRFQCIPPPKIIIKINKGLARWGHYWLARCRVGRQEKS